MFKNELLKYSFNSDSVKRCIGIDRVYRHVDLDNLNFLDKDALKKSLLLLQKYEEGDTWVKKLARKYIFGVRDV